MRTTPTLDANEVTLFDAAFFKASSVANRPAATSVRSRLQPAFAVRASMAVVMAVSAAATANAAPAPSRAAAPAPAQVTVGSKRFTESYILGEIAVQTLRAGGVPAEHRQGLGNTGILEQALASGAVDVYPEYTGTIVRELLKLPLVPGRPDPTLAELNRRLQPRGLVAAVPLGFGDGYALAMSEGRAQALGVTRLSDLSKPALAGLRLGLTHEFLQRGDGWPSLQSAYQLPQSPAGLDHGIAYEALKSGRIDVVDVYTTDAAVQRDHLRVLQDDRGHFPRYDAVLLMRADVDPGPLAKLQGRITEQAMTAMNAAVEVDGLSFAEVARRFLAGERMGAAGVPRSDGFWQRLFAPDFGRLALQHVVLVFGSLAMAVAVGVPLGVAAWRWPPTARTVLSAVSVLQTIPSLALLAFLIALLGGIGWAPAALALFVYALLPIVGNTHAGLRGVPGGLAEAARSLGLTPAQTLRRVQLPLAMPTLLAGVKTAAVINVGTATLAAFIGAGGFGERIVAGLAVNDNTALLAGAVPAAGLALLIEFGFELVERRLPGMRGRTR